MLTVPNDKILCVDIDGTLVDYVSVKDKFDHIISYGDVLVYLKERKMNRALMVHHKEVRDYFIIVWSANGKEWATKIIELLGLESQVDLIMTKPREYLDDKSVEKWMTNQIFVEEK